MIVPNGYFIYIYCVFNKYINVHNRYILRIFVSVKRLDYP